MCKECNNLDVFKIKDTEYIFCKNCGGMAIQKACTERKKVVKLKHTKEVSK